MRAPAAIVVTVLLLPIFLFLVPAGVRAETAPIVTVGDPDQMRTRNVLRSFIGVASTEDWGLGILRPVYSRPLLKHPATEG